MLTIATYVLLGMVTLTHSIIIYKQQDDIAKMHEKSDGSSDDMCLWYEDE